MHCQWWHLRETKMAKKLTIPENPTLQDVCDGYIESIQKDGRTSGTAASYTNDLKVATKFLGAQSPVNQLTVERVQEFFDSPGVTTKRNGVPKNSISIAKTRRILRLALVWATEAKWIKAAPLPKTTDVAPLAEIEPVVAAVDSIPQLTGFDHAELMVDPATKVSEKSKRGKKTKAVETAD